jgi:hypothetical protein
MGRYPIELETDCQALGDTISNNKLNSTQTHWLDGIIYHQIINYRHCLEKHNQVAMV